MNMDQIEDLVERALAEDLPDITAEAIFPPDAKGFAEIVAREKGVIAGLPIARAVFAFLDGASLFDAEVSDGDSVSPGRIVARVSATVRALLAGERTALNILQRASGIATMTARYVDAVDGTSARIFDTRKTAPGLRALDKYAVALGGGSNHRLGLHDMFLIKNNHIDAAGSITAAVERVHRHVADKPVMVEVRDLEELQEALRLGPDFILLDNMTPERMKEAVAIAGGRVPLEASGGITLETVREVARTGVSRISVGALTHSVVALDLAMRTRQTEG